MCITLARASRMLIKSGDMISREFPICIYLICDMVYCITGYGILLSDTAYCISAYGILHNRIRHIALCIRLIVSPDTGILYLCIRHIASPDTALHLCIRHIRIQHYGMLILSTIDNPPPYHIFKFNDGNLTKTEIESSVGGGGADKMGDEKTAVKRQINKYTPYFPCCISCEQRAMLSTITTTIFRLLVDYL